MKLVMECLVDVNTGLPLEIEVPDSYENFMENIAPLKQAAWESGRLFKMALMQEDK
jgi:hypothetical protein